MNDKKRVFFFSEDSEKSITLFKSGEILNDMKMNYLIISNGNKNKEK